ncbi:hypothetical protein ON010_g1639 [Phytophthora cinnamomi]|nr:hypothetical protein ON010_g1639 [Phytophthora cinnamomi]
MNRTASERARVAPATLADATPFAHVAPDSRVASLDGVAIAPLPSMLAPVPAAPSVQVEAGDTCVGGPVARSRAELLDAIDEVLGPDGKALPAPGVFAQGAGSARDVAAPVEGGHSVQEASSAASGDRRSTTRREVATNWTVSASAALGRSFGATLTQASPSSAIAIDAGPDDENSTRSIPIATCRIAVSDNSRLPDPPQPSNFANAYGSECTSSSDSSTPNENMPALSS